MTSIGAALKPLGLPASQRPKEVVQTWCNRA